MVVVYPAELFQTWQVERENFKDDGEAVLSWGHKLQFPNVI
jgi:hypothetical protein